VSAPAFRLNNTKYRWRVYTIASYRGLTYGPVVSFDLRVGSHLELFSLNELGEMNSHDDFFTTTALLALSRVSLFFVFVILCTDVCRETSLNVCTVNTVKT